MFDFDRREMILGGLIFSSSVLTARSLVGRLNLEQMEIRLGGRIGLAALDSGSGRSLSWRGDDRFAMCSSFKWVLAASILKSVDRGEARLDHFVRFSKEVLLGHSPVTTAHVKNGGMALGGLCAAAVEESDNAAANLLLAQVGGPAGFTRFLRGLGDTVTRLDRSELALNQNLPNDPRDTTSPSAMISNMVRILLEDVLRPSSRAKLLDWMHQSQTGLNRIRAGLPPNWWIGDKTGTGDRGAVIDNVFALPPKRKAVLIACYLSGSAQPAEKLELAQAEIGRLIAHAFG